jgi:hypothetical protein
MEPAMVAVVTAVIGAVGTVLGAWVGGRSWRRPSQENSRHGDASHLALDQGQGRHGGRPRASCR